MFAMVFIKCVSVAVLLLGISALGRAQIQFPSYRPQPTCVGTRLDKISLLQDMYVQYASFSADVPTMYAFHTCLWLKLDKVNGRKAATTLNYALDNSTNTDTLTVQYQPSQQTWTMNINGIRVFNAKAARVEEGRWNHFCQSWDGRTGQWSVWQNGAVLDESVNTKSIGLVIPAGGTIVTGQHQNTLFNGMDVLEGIIGSITLLFVSREPIPHSSSRGTRQYLRLLASDCNASDRGDVVGWLRTPRKTYGGVMSELANERCGNF